MKRLQSLVIVIEISVLFACQKPVTFTEPQPKDVAALAGFPATVHGKYLNSEDSSFLSIGENTLIRTYDFDEKVHISQLDSTNQIIGDSLFDLTTNTGQLIRIEGDSIVRHIHGEDTLFAIDSKNVLKKFKGYYFANIFMPPDTWEVKKLEFSRGKLILSSISAKEDLDQLKTVAESTQDTASSAFSPSRKQFKKFVRNDGFRDSEVYFKLID